MAFVLTRPGTSTGGGIPGTTLTGISIPAGNTVTLDAVDTLSTIACKWIVTIEDTLSSEVRSQEILGMHRFGTNPSHNVYGIVGDKIDFDIDVSIVGSAMLLQVTNNEPNTLNATIVRIQVLT